MIVGSMRVRAVWRSPAPLHTSHREECEHKDKRSLTKPARSARTAKTRAGKPRRKRNEQQGGAHHGYESFSESGPRSGVREDQQTAAQQETTRTESHLSPLEDAFKRALRRGMMGLFGHDLRLARSAPDQNARASDQQSRRYRHLCRSPRVYISQSSGKSAVSTSCAPAISHDRRDAQLLGSHVIQRR